MFALITLITLIGRILSDQFSGDDAPPRGARVPGGSANPKAEFRKIYLDYLDQLERAGPTIPTILATKAPPNSVPAFQRSDLRLLASDLTLIALTRP